MRDVVKQARRVQVQMSWTIYRLQRCVSRQLTQMRGIYIAARYNAILTTGWWSIKSLERCYLPSLGRQTARKLTHFSTATKTGNEPRCAAQSVGWLWRMQQRQSCYDDAQRGVSINAMYPMHSKPYSQVRYESNARSLYDDLTGIVAEKSQQIRIATCSCIVVVLGSCGRNLYINWCDSTEEKYKTLEVWGRAQREAARGVRKQALINF